MLIVPGWGMHSEPYAGLAEAVCERGGVAYGLDLPGHGRATSLSRPHALPLVTNALRAAIDAVAADWPEAELAIAGESAGGTYTVAAAPLRRVRRIALLAPGILPRWRQLVGLRAWRDSASLVLRGRLPLLGWRVEEVSRNHEFIETLRTDGLTLDSVNRRYVATVAQAAVHAFILGAPRTRGSVRIWHGAQDRVLSPLGSRLLSARLRNAAATFRLIPGADHGLLWDPELGGAIAEEVADWLCETNPRPAPQTEGG